MGIVSTTKLVVNKNNLQKTKVLEETYSDELAPNQVLFEVDTFSLTSNNITYGVLGEQLKYWQFFPAEEGYGIIPVWGFADVVVSNHPEVKVGQRFYGYYPMGTHLLVTAGRVSPFGFSDKTPHREGLASVYNFYSYTANDPSFTSETEALNALFRPLFTTSFLIDYHLVDENFFNATQIVITSASSKTAQALAFLLAERKKQHRLNINIVGLTSNTNLDFVKNLGWYDKVLPYDNLDQLNTNETFVVVDFTGNHNTQYQLQTTLGESLVYNCLVGLVDWQNLKGEKPLPKKGAIFFAPNHAAKRQQELGVAGFQQKIGIAWQQFINTIGSSLSVKEHHGAQELESVYKSMLNGKIDPQEGHMVRLQ
ncbi:DUF2855 family protein [Croceivirga thetidis]|uniref:DUF2855 family protein n=1 Tax=Croceivirga thetidis TaxID=2721623 RepID=A0ABX1GRP4_9FLAO|nr:DUF2855 family protein [Croceivirga thetidis]NKI32254.1 DUF2855 family protein [Croceivirga thetidis]